MNRIKRFLAQTLIWVAFTILLWNSTDQTNPNIIKEGLQLILQLSLVAFVIYFISNQLFIKRKIGISTVITLIILIGFSWIMSMQFNNSKHPLPREDFDEMRMNRPGNHPGFDEPRPEGPVKRNHPLPPPSRHAPSMFWNMLLIFSTTFSIAILWESTVFAMKKEEETIKNKAEHVKTELKLLKSQINPHFLFNSLNNIYALSVMDSDKTQQSISYLSEMLRYVLYECDQPLVPLQKEMEYLNNFIKLFSLKSSQPYNITTKFDHQNTDTLVAPMLFIPFIENALKHGNIEQRKSSFIRIVITSTSNEIVYQVENSVASQQKSTDEAGGIGLENVKKRLQILYQDRHHLQISQNPEEFKIKLTLQLT
jgi:hypothetical protein